MLKLTLASRVALSRLCPTRRTRTKCFSDAPIKHRARQKAVSEPEPLTERHLAGFAQLAVLAPLHLLIREDFLQRPGQKHALGFAVLRLRLGVVVLLLLRWPLRLLLLHLSVVLPRLSQAVILGLALRTSRWRGKLRRARLSV